MKTPRYMNDEIPYFLPLMLPVMFELIFFLPIIVITYLMAEEKELKLKNMMKMMGLKERIYVLSWFIIYLMIVTLISIITVLILSTNVL
jgi:hypothetical protein